MDCPFCSIPDHEPEKVLAAGLHAYALTPLDPVTPGHALIIPFRHVDDFTTSPEATAHAAEFAAWYAGEHIPGPVNLITSKGRIATQSVFHLHLHLIPRHENDRLALPWHSGKHRKGQS